MSPSPFSGVPIELPSEFEAQVDNFLGLMESWRNRVNLVSRNLTRTALLQHAMSSLAVLDPEVPAAGPPAGPDGLRLLDIGSGGGFPALILLMARPAWNGVLVEATGKKCFFLREAAGRFAPRRVTVLHQRYEEPGEERGPDAEAAAGPFDLVTLRAMRPEPKLVARMRGRLATNLAPGGRVAWYTPQHQAGGALALEALSLIGLEDIRLLRIEWAGATLAIGRIPGVSRET
jgi:16S rRNA G527 N7-methylase RsmG